jgi:hypothetical protein
MTPRTPRKVWFTQVGKDIVPNPQPCTEHDTEYHRADLSADLVRAGYLAGVKDVQEIASDAEVFDISDAAEYLAADPEAVAAIIASVLGEPT